MATLILKQINKKFLTIGELVTFDIYKVDTVINEGKKSRSQSIVVKSGSVISDIQKIDIMNAQSLYISEKDVLKYKLFENAHLMSVAKNEEMSTDEKAELIFTKAVEVMEKIFGGINEEVLDNEVKPLVSVLIEFATSDKQALASLLKITAHDYYTHTHSINVSVYAVSLGIFMGVSGEQLEKLTISAILHDLGKSLVNYDVINKPGKLDDSEFDEMKKHPQYGYDLAVEIGITDKDILSGIRDHHEKMCGSGYPRKLRGYKISKIAKIIAVCDVFDALSTRRSYKDPMSTYESFSLIREQMSDHLDMEIVKSFVLMMGNKG